MNRQKFYPIWHVPFLALMIMTSVSAARNRKEPVLTEQGKTIAAEYADMLAGLKKEIASLAPRVDEKARADFTERIGALRNVPPITKMVMGKQQTIRFGPSLPAFVEKQKEALLVARTVLKNADVFLADEKIYAKMAKFALLSHAQPKYLALFAQQGDEEKALIDTLLNDDKLVAQVMTMGGASGSRGGYGRYGQAMRNYRAIQNATKRSHEGFFQVWALAVSLQYTNDHYIYPGVPAAESLVKYYRNYLKAYDKGILDPAFSKFGGTGWNYRFVFPDSYTLEDIDWIRKVLHNYRPDHTRMEYRWRYCRIVRTDIPYLMGVSRPVRPDLKLSNIQDFFLLGGTCGPRAFVGQISGYAFGIPTRRAPSPGHGAMAHWTPDGWTTVLGPHFGFCSVNGMPGHEFLLESQARQDPKGFKKVLMCEWLGSALGEKAQGNHGSVGGFWRLMGFYKKKAIVEDNEIEDIGTTGEDLAESNEPVSPNSDWVTDGTPAPKGPDVPQVELKKADKTITTDANGVITIPVGAARGAKSTEKIRLMKSYDNSFVQAHYSLRGKRPELLKYVLNLPKAGKYEFTAHVCTVTVDQKSLLRVNRRTYVDVDLPYTKADWMNTKPVKLELKEGQNRIQYTHKVPNKGVSIKYFTLKPVKDD